MGYNENELWNMTPRKFFAMLNVALDYNAAKYGTGDKKEKDKTVDGYVDQIKW